MVVANLSGTNVSAPVRPFSADDNFPTAHASELLGGHHQQATLQLRDAIPPERRVEGMLCTVAGVTYRLEGGILNTNWRDVLADTAATAVANASTVAALGTAVSSHTARLNGLEVGVANSFATAAELPTTLNGTGAVAYFEVYKDPVVDNNGRYYKDPGTSLCFKVTNDTRARLIQMGTVVDTRRQLKSKACIVRDAAGKAVLWTIGGRLYFAPDPSVTAGILTSGGIDTRRQTASKIALFADAAGRVPLYLENGKFWAAGFTDELLAYLNSALSLGSAAIVRWVVFLVAGQSNALGLSNDSSNWLDASAVGRKWEYSNALVNLAEPVGASAPTGRTSTGSMWPAFALEYARLNPGTGVVIVPAASNGTTSAQWRADASTPVYDDTDTLFNVATARLKAAVAALKASGSYPDVRLGGVLYYQGESDSATVPATYRANLQSTLDGWRDPANFGPDFPMFLGITGHAGIEATYRPLRAEQRSFAVQTPYVYPAFEGMQFYYDELEAGGLGVRDTVHFRQTVYNKIGKCLAATVARSPIPTKPLK